MIPEGNSQNKDSQKKGGISIFQSIFISVNGLMFAVTLFANFDDALRFVGFFETLIVRWNDVLAWFWQYIFQVLNLNIELTDVERNTVTMSILVGVSFLIASIQSRWLRNSPILRFSIDNVIRIALIVPSVLFALVAWNLSHYQMSHAAAYVTFSGMGLLLITLILVNRPWIEKTDEQRIEFLSYLTVTSLIQISSIVLVFVMYLLAKMIKMAPPFL